MPILRRVAQVLGLTLTLGVTGACSSSTPTAAPPPSAPPPGETVPAAKANDGPADTKDAGGEHEHQAPHGGSLIELGEEYAHLELVLDPATGTLTGYALDGEAEQPVRLAQPTIALAVRRPGQAALEVTLAAVPNSLTGETVGDTSQFRVSVAALKGVGQFDGTVARVTVRGQEFTDVDFRFPSEGHD